MTDVDIAPYEGLIWATAKRYAPILDDDAEDVRQVLRIKAWQALVAWDASRSPLAGTDLTEARNSFVFSCLHNRVKDLLKQQDRLNQRRGGGPLHIEDLTDDLGSFEGRYMSAECQALIELEEADLQLPSTLTTEERTVVVLLVLHFTKDEIAVYLGVNRQRIRRLHYSVQEKMEDWRPTPPETEAVELALAA